jgi:glycosyltransferase involved in cell wall biosynthesis
MQRPVFSVVIPAFNAAPFIGAAIESVLDQNIAMAFEIVVVDDGSRDATAAIAERYDRRVRCLRQANGGPGSARNAGVRAADGNIIALLDADDIALPGGLEAVITFMLEQPEVDVCFGNMVSQSTPNADYLAGYGLDTSHDGFVQIDHPLERLLLAGDYVPTSGSCVRRSTYLAAGSQCTKRTMAEDYEFWCRIAARKGKFAYTAQRTVWYRQENQNNLMTTAYAYTGPVEAMYAILTEYGADLPRSSFDQAYRRFLEKVEMLLRYEWANGDPEQPTQRIQSLAPLIPRRMAWKWWWLTLLPGFLPRSARHVLIALRNMRRRAPSSHGRSALRSECHETPGPSPICEGQRLSPERIPRGS